MQRTVIGTPNAARIGVRLDHSHLHPLWVFRAWWFGKGIVRLRLKVEWEFQSDRELS